MAAPIPSKLDQAQCIQGSFDESTGRLRVDAQLTSTIVPPPGLEVNIQAIDDNIAIRNSANSNELLINTDGSINVEVTSLDIGPVSIGVVDKTGFTYGVDKELPLGGVFQDTSPTLSSGQSGAIRLTQYRGLHTNLRDSGGVELGTSGNPLRINPTGSTAQPVTQNTSPWIISGFVTANIGTTGGLALDSSLSIINTTLGSPFQAGGSIGNTSFGASQTGVWSVGRTWNLVFANDKTDVSGSSISVSNFPATQSVTQGTSPWIISGTVTANAGTNLNTSLLQLDTTGAKLNNIQGSTTLGQTGPLIQGAVTTSAPSYTTAQTSPLSLDTSGLLRISLKDSPTNTNKFLVTADPVTFASPQHFILDSGTLTTITNPVTVSQTTAANLNATIVGTGTLLVQAQQSGAWTTGRTWTLSSGTDSVAVIQSTSPWITNVSQFGGSNVVTGTGASGSGIPRVTVSNDSNILATQSGTWTVQQGTPPWSVVGNIASGSADSGDPVKTGGVFNSTLPTLTTGQRGDMQLDSSGRHIVSNSPIDGYKQTYSASILGLVAATTPTDIFTIYGSGTKTVRVTRILISATQNTSATRNILLIKRSTANTGGTSTNPTIIPNDSNNTSGTATITAYTANPTLGTAVGIVRARRTQILATNVTNPLDPITWDFGIGPMQAMVLRGTGQGLAINLDSITSSNNLFDITVEWTEE